jgi:orotate phosphoribosyltransferase
VSICYNRKEAKDHGEGGNIIGHKLSAGDRIVIVDDVITAGTSMRESAALIQSVPGVAIRALAVSVDRMEKGPSGQSALAEAAATYNIEAVTIVTINDIVLHLHNRPIDGVTLINDAMKTAIDEYRAKYGVA